MDVIRAVAIIAWWLVILPGLVGAAMVLLDRLLPGRASGRHHRNR